jgi:two-component system CheB/CheR fusion protein
VKNLLATVSSLAVRMLKGDPSPKEFAESFLARLRAMGTMHELLAKFRWEGAELDALVTAAVAEYADVNKGNLSLIGPQVMLKPSIAASLGLVLHELATNAAKYGALSAPHGRIHVTWRVDGNPGERLSLTWSERGGPPIAQPPKEGFGLTFVKRSMGYELDGEVDIALKPEGIDVALTIPLEKDETAIRTGTGQDDT